MAAQDNIYEYIVFRGSDVKDLRIEKEPEEKPPSQPQVPDDPAILGVSEAIFLTTDDRRCVLTRLDLLVT